MIVLDASVIIARLAQLRAETGLQIPDYCVLDATLTMGAPLATLDQRLAALAEGRRVSLAR